MATIVYVPAPGYDSSEKGIINQGNGVSFDIGAALIAGGGQISVDGSANPTLVGLLDHFPGLVRSGVTPGPVVIPDSIAPVIAHTGSNPQVGDYLVRGSDGLFAPQPGASVAITSAPNVFTAAQTITPLSGTGAALNLNGSANQLQLTQTTDWGANLVGNTTYDSLDIFHKSAGDGVYIVHAGGVSQAKLLTGTVASNNGITYMAMPSLSGAAQNAITVRHLVSGTSTPLSVSVSGSAITVNVATDGSGNPTSTAAQVIAAVNASAAAYALVSAYNTTTSAGTSTGAGVVASLAATNLAGGFTGSTPGANSALNPYVPFWLDDVGSGTGTTVGYRSGRRAMIAYNNAAYDPQGVCFSLNHAAGGPAIQLNNQSPTQYGCPQVSGIGIALHLNDYSAAASINIVRNTAPVAGNSASAFTYQPAVISVTSAAAGNFPVLIATHSGDSQGVYIRNDGNVCFGLNQNPALGRVQIDSNSATVANTLTLSNSNATANAGVAINYLGPANVQTAQISSPNIDSNTSYLQFSVRNAGALTGTLVQLRGTTMLMFVQLNMQDGNDIRVGTGTGTRIGTAGGAAGQKLGFFNATPVVQPLLATGASHTVDDVITTLQTLGLVRQS